MMRLYREDRAELARRDDLDSAKASAEEVLHPSGATEIFESADELEAAYAGPAAAAVPRQPARYGMRRDPQMGELAGRVDTDSALSAACGREALRAGALRGGGGARVQARTPR